MSQTKGSGPFGAQPVGSFNFDPQPPEHVLYVERSPRRVQPFHGAEPVRGLLCFVDDRQDVEVSEAVRR